MHYNLSDVDSVANQFLLSMRDKSIQSDRAGFRRNLERLGSIMAYEISKKLRYRPAQVQTPLGIAKAHVLEHAPVLITILRAGLPFFNGFHEFFHDSDCGFIGAYREEGRGHITIKLDYAATPKVGGREMIVIDPMLATGRSLIDALKTLARNGEPAHIHIACVIATPEGLQYVANNLKPIGVPYTIWSFSVDERLDERFYIVPGLGDAGDLSFGNKI